MMKVVSGGPINYIKDSVINSLGLNISSAELKQKMTPKNVWLITMGSIALTAVVLCPPAWLALSATVQIGACLTIALANIIVMGLCLTRTVARDAVSIGTAAASTGTALLSAMNAAPQEVEINIDDFVDELEQAEVRSAGTLVQPRTAVKAAKVGTQALPTLKRFAGPAKAALVAGVVAYGVHRICKSGPSEVPMIDGCGMA
jgi:hypothetical protein